MTFLQSPSTSQLLSGLIEIGKQKRSSSLRLLNGDIKRDLEVMVLYATKKKKSRRTAKDRFSEAFEGGGSFLDMMFSRNDKTKKKEKEKSENDLLLEKLDSKPWRANKIKHLPITYRPCKESWRERYRDEQDDTIYMYNQPQIRTLNSVSRTDDLWEWPWAWTKTKAERLGWLHKLFYVECEQMTVQEHMEMDAFFAEFDMPTRWGLLRMKELDVLNAIILNLVVFTDFDGTKPTDLGLRPDGTVKTCPTQFVNCISSSNSPSDTDHYAPPLKWDRAKSPEQAYEEIKRAYFDYPKRGLKWTNGWIDRGGWDPRQFSGNYFYSQAHSLVWHYTDDIELVLEPEKREVQYRSSTRIGIADWDVERLRYNQFVRMLDKKGGWEVKPLEKLHWYRDTPIRWSKLLLKKGTESTERVLNRLAVSLPGLVEDVGDEEGAARRVFQQLEENIHPYVQPLLGEIQALKAKVINNPETKGLLQSIETTEKELEATFSAGKQEVESLVDQAREQISIIREQMTTESDSSEATMNSVSEQSESDANAGGAIKDQQPPQVLQRLLDKNPFDGPTSSEMDIKEEVLSGDQFLIEDIIERQKDETKPHKRRSQSVLTNGETKVLRKQLDVLKKKFAISYE